MNHPRHLLASLALLVPGLVPALSAADTPPPPKSGFTVLLEMKIDENGRVEDANVVNSDDPSKEHLLERNALRMAHEVKLTPRLKDGQAVKYTARAPFFFPVEGDEGPEDPGVIKPKILNASQPVYPPEEAAKGEVGAVILELMVGADGRASNLKVLRGSSPVFEQAATNSVAQWTFAPATQNGTAIASRWRMSICFETDLLAADWTWRIAPRPSLGNYTVVHRTQAAAPPVKPAEEPASPAEKK